MIFNPLGNSDHTLPLPKTTSSNQLTRRISIPALERSSPKNANWLVLETYKHFQQNLELEPRKLTMNTILNDLTKPKRSSTSTCKMSSCYGLIEVKRSRHSISMPTTSSSSYVHFLFSWKYSNTSK